MQRKSNLCVATIMLMGMLTFVMMACSSDDYGFLGEEDEYVANQTELKQSWQLIGYGSESNFHMIDEEFRKKSETYGYRFWIAFKPDGTLEGRDAVNSLYGEYTCNGNQINIVNLVSTEIYDKYEEESSEFTTRLHTSSNYGIKDSMKLRIYYSPKEFLYFEPLYDRLFQSIRY